MNHAQDLEHQLREAGHDDVADLLARKELGTQLRAQGRDDLAEQLESERQAEARPAEAPSDRINPEAEARDLAESLARFVRRGDAP